MFKIIAQGQQVGEALPWIGVLAVLIVMFIAGWFVFRKWVMNQSDASSGTIFTLQELRELHARGEITQAEFTALKGQMLADQKDMIEPGSEKK